jgi:hypothetical protein
MSARSPSPPSPPSSPSSPSSSSRSALAARELWLLVVDLDGGALDRVVAAREQVCVRVADGERVQQQPAHGVRDLGLPGDRVGDQLCGAPQQVRIMGTFP